MYRFPILKQALKGKETSILLETIQRVDSEYLPLEFWQKDTFADFTLEEAELLIKGFYGSKHIAGIVLEFKADVFHDEYITTFRNYNPNKFEHYSKLVNTYLPLRINNDAYKLKGLTDEDLDFLFNLPQNANHRGEENGFPKRFLQKISSERN